MYSGILCRAIIWQHYLLLLHIKIYEIARKTLKHNSHVFFHQKDVRIWTTRIHNLHSQSAEPPKHTAAVGVGKSNAGHERGAGRDGEAQGEVGVRTGFGVLCVCLFVCVCMCVCVCVCV